MTVSPPTVRARQLIGKATQAGRVAQRNLRRTLDSRAASDAPADAPSARLTGAHLSPVTALRENGYTVFRGLFGRGECVELSRQLKLEAKITDGVKFTKVDATNFFPTSREIMLDGRIVDAVRSAIGTEAKFLQVSDLHYLHDTAGWHRDSVHRAHDSSASADWSDGQYGVVKAILYLEADNAAMGIMAGSHASPIEMEHDAVKRIEQAGGQLVIGADTEPNTRLSAEQRRIPLAWKAEVGDVLVFDERMYHCGRRVEHGRVAGLQQSPKFTLSTVWGTDNHHSERLYSYFRFARRELHYGDLPADFRTLLAERGLVLGRGWTNYYFDHPQDLRHAYLRDPAQLEPLIAQFSQGRG